VTTQHAILDDGVFSAYVIFVASVCAILSYFHFVCFSLCIL